jgi:hypothetical protein
VLSNTEPKTYSHPFMVFTYAVPVDMGYIDEEEQKYLQEVEDVKRWWSDSRWRHTKRPFTAEQIVQKRGTIKIEYPSNTQAKKLWRIVEDRFKVSLTPHIDATSNGSHIHV